MNIFKIIGNWDYFRIYKMYGFRGKSYINGVGVKVIVYIIIFVVRKIFLERGINMY